METANHTVDEQGMQKPPPFPPPTHPTPPPDPSVLLGILPILPILHPTSNMSRTESREIRIGSNPRGGGGGEGQGPCMTPPG